AVFDGYVAEFAAASATIGRNISGLKDYVVQEMKRQEFKQLPGNRWRFTLIEGESLSYDREATPEDYYELKERFPGLVQQKTVYSFDWNVVKTLHGAGTIPEGIASKKPKKAHIRAYPNTPKRAAPKPKKDPKK